MRDVVGLYLNPPDRALVLCVDDKSQIQALDRTAHSADEFEQAIYKWLANWNGSPAGAVGLRGTEVERSLPKAGGGREIVV